jgi:hypothetical protein
MKSFKDLRTQHTLEESKMSEIQLLVDEGKTAKEIAKLMKMKLKDVKGLTGLKEESDELEEKVDTVDEVRAAWFETAQRTNPVGRKWAAALDKKDVKKLTKALDVVSEIFYSLDEATVEEA